MTTTGRAYIIADIGACHDGDPEKMRSAILAAVCAGVDAIKFQWTSAPFEMAERRRSLGDGYGEIYKRYLAWSPSWHATLAGYCASMSIDYMCTAFLPRDVAVVAPYVARFKIASFEASDREMISASFGAAQDRDTDTLVSVGFGQTIDPDGLGASPNCWRRIKLLLCTSSYPAPFDQINLARIRDSGEPFGANKITHCAGFSDHTDPALTWTGALAVAAGARIVEAHLRLDETDSANPDYPHAMTQYQFSEYVRHVRFAEACLGTAVRAEQPSEAAMARYRVGVD